MPNKNRLWDQSVTCLLLQTVVQLQQVVIKDKGDGIILRTNMGMMWVISITYLLVENVAVSKDGLLYMIDRFGFVLKASGDGKDEPVKITHLGPGRPLGFHFNKAGDLIICNAGVVRPSFILWFIHSFIEVMKLHCFIKATNHLGDTLLLQRSTSLFLRQHRIRHLLQVAVEIWYVVGVHWITVPGASDFVTSKLRCRVFRVWRKSQER